MMLIPPTLSLGTTDTNSSAKEKYFSSPGIYSTNPVPAPTGVADLSPESHANQSLYQSAPVEGRMFLNAPKMQSDLPAFHMHAAAAVVTGHPGSFPLNSPASYAAGAATAPSHSIVPAHYGSPALDPTPYYSSLGPGYDMKGGDMWNGGYNQPAHTYYQYEPGFAPQYPYERCYPMDMNDGVRRKNATRESTNTLKAWLQEHKKNPYPTKGEKIMLAIITKMTLTQVSTWFANARRRLKKENKMTWIPKNRANESGSGTEDRRASDDKDSDEKSDDEDCKSDKEDNDECPDTKPNSDQDTNSSCQFSQQNPPSLPYHHITLSPNSLDPVTQEGAENHEVKSSQEYSRMMSGLPSENTGMLGTSTSISSLSDKLHSANMVQNAVPMKYETGPEGYNRTGLWSPIDSHSQKSMPAARPYQTGYGTDYHCQAGYHQDPEGRRHSSTHPQNYPANYDMPPLPHISMSHNSQEGHHLHNHSTTSHMGRKIFSPMSHDVGNKHMQGSSESELAQDSSRRNGEYPYSSPMTNLRNYVNGVFQGSSQQVPGAPMCDKNTMGQVKSPNSGSEQVVSPSGGAHYQQQHQQYDQRYLHQHQGHSMDNPIPGQPAYNNALQRSISGSYPSYYSEGTNCYSSQSLADSSQQHSGGPFYSHQPNPIASHTLPGDPNSSEITRPSSSNASEQYSAGQQQQHCQGSPPSCRQSATSGIAERRSSTCIGYYDGPVDSSNASSARSTVPPPPYNNQCKYAEGNTQAYAGTPSRTVSHRPSYDALNPGSNQSASSHSPRGVQQGLQTRESGTYGCVVASDDEEMRKIHSNDAISEKVSR